MKYQLPRHKEESKRVKVNVPVILGVCTALLLFAQVVVSNQLAGTGAKINSIESEIQELTENNSRLREQTASASSLLTIRAKAQEKGFTETINPTYLTDDVPVALKY